MLYNILTVDMKFDYDAHMQLYPNTMGYPSFNALDF